MLIVRCHTLTAQGGLVGTASRTMTSNYEPKNVLITGGAGFIASHVAILFAKKYPHYKVRATRVGD